MALSRWTVDGSFEWSIDKLWNDALRSSIKPRSLVVADKFKVCVTCNRKQLNLLYCGEECLLMNSAFLIGPAVFCCRQINRSVRLIEDEDLSSRTARLASFDQLTVSHRSSWARGTRRHLVRRNNESSSAVRSQHLRHSSALRACCLHPHT